jgi:hypothetical protein
MDYIMRPILAKLCSMKDARDGSLDLADFALMNDALMVKAENEWRAMEASKNG